MLANKKMYAEFNADQTYGVDVDKMTSSNPIVALEHVPNNDWGAGLSPIWRDGTVSQVVWTKMANLYGIKTARFPDTSTITKAVIHYNNKTAQFCGLELLD